METILTLLMLLRKNKESCNVTTFVGVFISFLYSSTIVNINHYLIFFCPSTEINHKLKKKKIKITLIII